eukprot:TRINITY_DN6958_c0_g1_i3.p1 TRINITY_DN6958_c0_g1~~TRINITY_DN6958_c0_g1_i3.p1  ORF type:complete len:110 (+),score=15.51 TRINITY_DN6958_c0_g1_i3:293-622(+)
MDFTLAIARPTRTSLLVSRRSFGVPSLREAHPLRQEFELVQRLVPLQLGQCTLELLEVRRHLLPRELLVAIPISGLKESLRLIVVLPLPLENLLGIEMPAAVNVNGVIQ